MKAHKRWKYGSKTNWRPIKSWKTRKRTPSSCQNYANSSLENPENLFDIFSKCTCWDNHALWCEAHPHKHDKENWPLNQRSSGSKSPKLQVKSSLKKQKRKTVDYGYKPSYLQEKKGRMRKMKQHSNQKSAKISIDDMQIEVIEEEIEPLHEIMRYPNQLHQ